MVDLQTNQEKEIFSLKVYQKALRNLMVAYYLSVTSSESVDYSLIEANIGLYLRRANSQLEVEPYNDRRES